MDNLKKSFWNDLNNLFDDLNQKISTELSKFKKEYKLGCSILKYCIFSILGLISICFLLFVIYGISKFSIGKIKLFLILGFLINIAIAAAVFLMRKYIRQYALEEINSLRFNQATLDKLVQLSSDFNEIIDSLGQNDINSINRAISGNIANLTQNDIDLFISTKTKIENLFNNLNLGTKVEGGDKIKINFGNGGKLVFVSCVAILLCIILSFNIKVKRKPQPLFN